MNHALLVVSAGVFTRKFIVCGESRQGEFIALESVKADGVNICGDLPNILAFTSRRDTALFSRAVD